MFETLETLSPVCLVKAEFQGFFLLLNDSILCDGSSLMNVIHTLDVMFYHTVLVRKMRKYHQRLHVCFTPHRIPFCTEKLDVFCPVSCAVVARALHTIVAIPVFLFTPSSCSLWNEGCFLIFIQSPDPSGYYTLRECPHLDHTSNRA